MAFPVRGVATMTPPAVGAASAPPTPPTFSAPPTPPGPPAPPVAPPASVKVYVPINGAAVLMDLSALASYPGTTQAMAENQQGGWKTLADFRAPAAAAPVHTPAPAAGAFAGRVAQPQHASVGGAFAGIEGAQITRNGNFPEEGDYVVKLKAAEYKPLRSGKFAVILETEVLVSSFVEGDPSKAKCNREGSSMTIFINKNDSFLGNMKEVVLALCGFDDKGNKRPESDTVTAAECEAVVSPEQPFTGAICYIEARQKQQQKDPSKEFTRIAWWPMPIKPDGTLDFDKLAATR